VDAATRRDSGQRLDDRMVDFIRRQELLFVTLARGGRTSRSGPPGFVRVPSRRLLAWPEFDVADPPLTGRVQLMLLDLFHQRAVLHIVGVATVAAFAPPQVCGPDPAAAPGPRPDFWVRVRVDQAWFAG